MLKKVNAEQFNNRRLFICLLVCFVMLLGVLVSGCGVKEPTDNADAKNQPKTDEKIAEYVKDRYPYAGMPEKFVEKTKLGKADLIEEDTLDANTYENVNTHYVWYTTDGKYMVCSATAHEGEISFAFINPGPWWDEKTETLNRDSYSFEDGSKGWDEYGVNQYDNPEVFGGDWAQQFEQGDGRGYQDAYNYWLEYHE